jgi:anti-sigma-K factor RskA
MRHKALTDDLQERASLFAAGAMTDSERQEYARHLEEDQCSVCRAEVDELQSAVSMLAFGEPSVSPSPDVRTRLMEQARNAERRVETVQPVARWPQWAATTVAAASVAVALYTVQINSDLRRQTAELNSRIAQLEVQLSGQRTTLAMLTSAGVRIVDLAGQGDNLNASGRIFWDQQRRRWYFYARDLPPVPADRSYQLWFVPATGNPLSVNVFNTGSDGSIQFEVPAPDTMLKAAAVTTEPAGGLTQPSGPFALLGAM